jgi:hypothetical protein
MSHPADLRTPPTRNCEKCDRLEVVAPVRLRAMEIKEAETESDEREIEAHQTLTFLTHN